MHHVFHFPGAWVGEVTDAIKRALERRQDRWHPELNSSRPSDVAVRPIAGDVAIDFVDMAAIVDRMHAAFFRER